jgi:RNA polymerase sigma-70 factor (ECF subfamily)
MNEGIPDPMLSEAVYQPVGTDELLAQQALSSREAFGELYRRHFDRVYRYHYARTGSVPDAQDLTTQTFLAALEGIGGYRGQGSFAAWLFGIARRLLALHYRAQRDLDSLDELPEVPSPGPGLEVSADQRIDLEDVSRRLRRMVPERAEAVVLCLFSEFSADEAGRVMGKSGAAVKMLLYRGLRDLRQAHGPATLEEA